MASDDGRLLLAAIVGFGGGLYSFVKGFREYRKYRLIADTPAMRIRGIPMGLVQVRGEARAEETLVSPVTHTSCYLFRVVVEEWHSDSDGGGEWKHVATDTQSVKFYLQDATGNVLIDAANAELDLPPNPVRKVHSSGRSGTASPSLPAQAAVASSGLPVTDEELLQYIEVARVRGFTRMVGRGIGFVSHAVNPSHDSQRQSLMNMMADPLGSGADGFRNYMMKAMLARRDPTGETTRLALEVWKHPQGTPEFDSALVRLAQAYGNTMAPATVGLNSPGVLELVRRHPEALTMAASLAAAAEPQADPEAEKARQTAEAFARDNMAAMMRRSGTAASGNFRLTEHCLLPGHTYDVMGTCAENPNPRDDHDRNIILRGTNESTFLISSRAGKDVQSWLLKRSLWMILGGAALAVVGLAILLGKLGLL